MTTLTKKTVITWAQPWVAGAYPEGDAARKAKIKEMTTQLKTDGITVEVTPLIHERYWVDQAAAEEFVSYIMGLVDQGLLGPVTGSVISDR